MQIENRETFQQHLTNHSLTCQDYEKRFSRKDALKRHQKNACVNSSKHRKILCDKCGTVKKGTFCTCTVREEEKHQCEFCSFRVNTMQELFQHVLDKHRVVQTSVSERFFLPTNNSNDLLSNLNHTKSSESLLQTGGETQSGINKSVPDVSNALTQTGGKQSTRNRKQKTTFRVKRTTNSISALNNAANKHYITPGADEKYDLLTFLANMHTDVVNHLQKRCQELKQIVWYVAVKVDMQRQSVDGVTQISTPHFRPSSFKILDANFSASDDVDKGFQSLYKNFEEYNDRGSGWTLKKIIHIEISTVVYDPLPGRTYFTEPTKIKNSKAILNIQNVDEKCFYGVFWRLFIQWKTMLNG